MGQHFNTRSTRQQQRVARKVQGADAGSFFNLLTSPRLLEVVEAELPEHRERGFPPTLSLSMFWGKC